MPALKKTKARDDALPIRRPDDSFDYPTGMVWCPMKMSGMAVMRCARLQRELGCGTLNDLRLLKTIKPQRVVLFWPWLKRWGECPERATEKEFRELLRAVTPLRLVRSPSRERDRCRCPGCGGPKGASASLCRPCWLCSVKANKLRGSRR
ncbi:MAG TPA: hypothetical protein VNN77_08595 [candidate division Zixibacteria bacterium]|nr:hypothetical protein [candidate division Zixibacteria bacterium]